MPYLVFEPNSFGFPKGCIQYKERIFKTNIIKDKKYFENVFNKLKSIDRFMENYAIRDILEYDDCDFIVFYEEELEAGIKFQELMALDNLLQSVFKK